MPEQTVVWVEGVPYNVDDRGRKVKANVSDNPHIDGIYKLLRAAAVNEKTLPYLAAFGFGSLIGWHNEKTFEGSMRVGLEAIVFTHLATTEGTPSQILGVAGLTGIGLSLPSLSFVAAVNQAAQNFPWIYPNMASAPSGGIDVTPIVDAIKQWWADWLESQKNVTPSP